jgi:hypothetical protein
VGLNRIVHFGWAALLVAGLCTWLLAPASATADCGSATSKANRSRQQGSAQLKGNDRNDTGLEITLVNGKGLPIVSANVSLENKRRHIRLASTTDAQGQVYIALPDAGRYRIKIVFPDKPAQRLLGRSGPASAPATEDYLSTSDDGEPMR